MQSPLTISQSQGSAPSNLFTLSGEPIRVFVEASGVQSRPKLIRSLRNAGASICHAPGDAQVILVDSSTPEGVQFVREWNADPGKVVLESTWARKCIKAGRLLWAAENWDGCTCILSTDGQSVVFNSADEEANPLPTPSPTPTRPLTAPESAPAPSSSKPVIWPTANDSVHSAQSNNVATNHLPDYPNSSASQHPLQSPAASSQYAPITAPPFSPMSQAPMSQPPYGQLSTQLSALPPHMQQIPPNMLPELINMYAMQRLYQGSQMWSMLSAPFSPMLYAGQVDQAANMSYAIPQQSQSQPQLPTANTSMSPGPQGVPSPIPSSSKIRRDTQSPFSKDLAPSLKRKAPSTSSNSRSPSPLRSSRTPVGSKGKERADPPVSFDKDESPSSSQITQTASSMGSPPRRTIIALRKEGRIFVTDEGEPLLFHVQVDLKNRMQVIQAIKKNGGKITPDIENADYIILYTRSKTFNALYDSTEANGKFPIQANFVMECVEEKALLDSNHYILEHPDPKRKRKKVKTSKSKANGTKTSVVRKLSSATPKSRPEPETGPFTEDGDSGHSSGFEHDLESPPPPTKHTLLSSGKYLFTEEEKEYAKKYIEVCLMRDPTTSGNWIAQRLAAKMPTHPLSSWKSTVGRMNSFTDAMRKQGVAAREQAKATVDTPSTPDLPSASNGRDRPTIPINPEQDIYTQELNYLIGFLMTNDPKENEQQTFQRLENQFRCQTSPTWIQFYDTHVDDITRVLGVDANGHICEAGPQYKVET